MDSKTAKQEKKRAALLEKEILSLEKREAKMAAAAGKATSPAWKTGLENRIPVKVYQGLESTFVKGFSLVFMQGKALIERTYDREDIQQNHNIRNYAIRVKGGRKEIRQMRKGASHSSLLNLTVTTAEGIALGALGIGMPDIVLFLSTLLKGIYEVALNYGFTYDAKQEQYFILKMMEASLSTGEAWHQLNDEINCLMSDSPEITEEDFQQQLHKTASAFAMDMLLLKFIQGLPIVGIVGGAANPFYYNKVMRYVQLKYNKRYLLQLCTRSILCTD